MSTHLFETAVKRFATCLTAIACMVLIAFDPQPALAITQAEATAYVEKHYGRVLSRIETPELYQALGQMFERLSEASSRRVVGADTSSDIAIIRSPVINAFVITLQEQGITRAKNKVFLTSAILERYLGRASNAAKLQEGFEMLGGIMAHELGHPVDKLDRGGIEDHYGSSGQQAIEIRADTEAVLLLREANLPTDSLLRALNRLQEGQANTTNLLIASTSTHPDQDIRSSAQRTVLTLERLQGGLQSSIEPLSLNTENAIAEMQNLSDVEFRMPVSGPRTIQEALGKIKSEMGKRNEGLSRNVWPINAYALWVTQKFESYGPFKQWSETQKKEMRDFISLLVRPNLEFERTTLFVNRRHIRKIRDHISQPELFSGDEPVMKRLERTGYFGSPEFREVLANGENSLGHLLRDTVDIVPADIIVPWAYRKIGDLPGYLKHFRGSSEHELKAFEGGIEYLEKLMRTKKYEKMLVSIDLLLVIPRKSDEFFSKLNSEKYSSREAMTRFERARQVAKYYWDRRGYFGTLEMSGLRIEMGWEEIADILSIDRLQAKSLILSEVKNYLRGRPVASAPFDYSTFMNRLMGPNHLTGQDARNRDIRMANPRLTTLPFWADESLVKYTSGEFLTSNNDVKRYTRIVLHKELLYKFKNLHRQALARSLDAQLLNRPSVGDGPAFFELLKSIYEKEFGQSFRGGLTTPNLAFDQLSMALEHLAQRNTADPRMRPLIREVLSALVSSNQTIYGEFLTQEARIRELYSAARTSGAVSDYIDFISVIGQSQSAREAFRRIATFTTGSSAVNQTDISRTSSRISKSLARQIVDELTELNRRTDLTSDLARSRFQRYQEFVGNGGSRNNMPYRDAFAAQMISLAQKANLAPAERLSFFSRITRFSVTNETDAYFQTQVLPVLENRDRSVGRLLLKDRIHNAELQVELTRRVLSPVAEQIGTGSGPTSNQLYDFAENIHLMARQDSSSRDQMIEDFAWRLGVEGQRLKSYFEDEKSSNWRKGNPQFVRMGSALATILRDLSNNEKFALLDYVMYPQRGAGMPDSLYRLILRRYELLNARAMRLGAQSQDSERAAFETKTALESVISTTRPVERVPIIDLILTTGNQNSLINNETLFEHIIEHILRFERGSVELTMLRAYLDVIPAHERSITLSYVLANNSIETSGQRSGNLKSILEVFGTVGIKFGQMAATWDVFGPQYREELQDLNDRAKPMTLSEIEAELTRSLLPEERRLIKRPIRILGSASVKSVVLVELLDGRRAALMLRRPNAPQQISSNTRLAKAFLKRLRETSIESTHPLFQPLVEALENQLSDEINFRREVEKINQVRTMIGESGQALSGELRGWRVEVPGVLSDIQPKENFFLMQLGEGVTLKEYLRDNSVSSAERAQVGEAVTKLALRMLFQHGYFDPDRHSGNWLIDRTNKKISFIDPGQLINFNSSRNPFRYDARVTLALFMKAINDKNATDLVHYAKQMAESGSSLSRQAEAELTQKLSTLLRTRSLDQALQESVIEIYRSGLKLHQNFSFGALKGFMTLYGSVVQQSSQGLTSKREGAITSEKFVELLEGEIRPLVARKLPVMISERVRSLLNRAPPAASVANSCARVFN